MSRCRCAMSRFILRHAHLTTTQIYTEDDDHEVIRRVHQHLAARADADTAPSPPVASGYAAADLNVLLGGLIQ